MNGQTALLNYTWLKICYLYSIIPEREMLSGNAHAIFYKQLKLFCGNITSQFHVNIIHVNIILTPFKKFSNRL